LREGGEFHKVQDHTVDGEINEEVSDQREEQNGHKPVWAHRLYCPFDFGRCFNPEASQRCAICRADVGEVGLVD